MKPSAYIFFKKIIFLYLNFVAEGENILINGRRDSNQMLMELKEFMDIKDELTHKLSDLEAEYITIIIIF